jgi:hypothetical protein
MNTYEITIKIPTKDAFYDFVERVGPTAGEMTVVVEKVIKEDAVASMAQRARAPKKQLRGSKVNDTILTTLRGGPTTIKQLKEALEAKNLSAGSLSTGIAALTKSRQIERTAEGVYGLADWQAAAQ